MFADQNFDAIDTRQKIIPLPCSSIIMKTQRRQKCLAKDQHYLIV